MRPVAVIGAGPAGCAAACELARAGRQVVVFERERDTGHKLCGEFLGGPALACIAALGVDPFRHGAQPIDRVRLVRRDRVVERRLPFPAAGLSRRTLDTALRARAEALGAEIHYGARVTAATARDLTIDGAQFPAGAVLLASGKHDLRGHARVGPEASVVGFKTHLRLAAAASTALAGAVELFLFRDGYAGLQMVEDGRANLCLLTDLARFSSWPDLLAELASESKTFGTRLAGAAELFERPLAIARVPYGFVHSHACEDGVFRLGDQMGVIPSFAGEGIGIALHTGNAAAEAILSNVSAEDFHASMRVDVGRPIARATFFYRAGQSATGQAVLMESARLVPGLLGWMARLTRVGKARTELCSAV